MWWLVLGGRVCWVRRKISSKGNWWECTFVWWGNEPAEEWSVLQRRVAIVGRRLWGSSGWRRRVPTKGASSTRVRIAKWVIFLSSFVMVCSHFSWWFWLKFLICCCNFSGMAPNHVMVGTERKSMLSTSKNLLQRRLRRLMRVHLCMMRQWTSRRMMCPF